MKCEVEKKDLENALAIALRAVRTNSPLPILQNLVLDCKGDQLTILSTNLDASYEVTLPCSGVTDGAACVPAKLATDIVGKLPGAPVTISLDQATVTFKYGRGKFQLSALPAEEFPRQHQFEHTHTVPAHTFANVINSVAFATAASTESRAVMTGIWVRANAGQVQVCSTDGRRCVYTATMADGFPDGKSICPGDEMRQLAKLLLKMPPDECVSCYFDHTNASFKCGNVTFSFRLMEGMYPDVDRIRPAQNAFERSARVGREALAGAISRMMVVACEKQSPNLITLSFSDSGSVVLSANTPDVGTAQDEVACVYEGADLLIAFNGKYLLEFLHSLASEEVQILMQDDQRSAMVAPYPAMDTYALDYVIMPIRLREVVESA